MAGPDPRGARPLATYGPWEARDQPPHRSPSSRARRSTSRLFRDSGLHHPRQSSPESCPRPYFGKIRASTPRSGSSSTSSHVFEAGRREFDHHPQPGPDFRPPGPSPASSARRSSPPSTASPPSASCPSFSATKIASRTSPSARGRSTRRASLRRDDSPRYFAGRVFRSNPAGSEGPPLLSGASTRTRARPKPSTSRRRVGAGRLVMGRESSRTRAY